MPTCPPLTWTPCSSPSASASTATRATPSSTASLSSRSRRCTWRSCERPSTPSPPVGTSSPSASDPTSRPRPAQARAARAPLPRHGPTPRPHAHPRRLPGRPFCRRASRPRGLEDRPPDGSADPQGDANRPSACSGGAPSYGPRRPRPLPAPRVDAGSDRDPRLPAPLLLQARRRPRRLLPNAARHAGLLRRAEWPRRRPPVRRHRAVGPGSGPGFLLPRSRSATSIPNIDCLTSFAKPRRPASPTHPREPGATCAAFRIPPPCPARQDRLSGPFVPSRDGVAASASLSQLHCAATGEDYLVNVRLVEACYESAATGRVVAAGA